MDPLTLMAIGSLIGAGTGVAGLFKKPVTPGISQTAPQSLSLGAKEPWTVGNPYNNNFNNLYQQQQQQQQPNMFARPRLSSTLGRYGGIG